MVTIATAMGLGYAGFSALKYVVGRAHKILILSPLL